METLERIAARLQSIEARMLLEADRFLDKHPDIHSLQLPSARNLLHYLVLRSEEIRELQNQLHAHGLSSLASSESHIHRQLQAIMERLGHSYPDEAKARCNYELGLDIKLQKKQLLFGKQQNSGTAAIMVTFSSGYADDYARVKQLLQSGMNVARINCAHDSPEVWRKMIIQLRKAQRYTGLDCKVYMDLAGPKIRVVLLGKGAKNGEVKVKEGQLIWLAYKLGKMSPEELVISPNEPGIVDKLKKGERVYIDDGMIKGVVEKVKSDRVAVRIRRISSRKRKIKAQKGLNFPDSYLNLSPLTDYDLQCLPFICKHADLVGYSFISKASDLRGLREKMTGCCKVAPHVILKIETPEAVRNLPHLLLEGMQQAAFGVMIARGDLAIEIGFERMGEIQDEIQWICEAAHVPVIWATQVLDHMNKTGLATRAEITDAGQAALSECVMVNKGPHMQEVLETLKDISKRALSHRVKKRYIFRPLLIAVRFLKEAETAENTA
jgi:pyruvate kinase